MTLTEKTAKILQKLAKKWIDRIQLTLPCSYLQMDTTGLHANASFLGFEEVSDLLHPHSKAEWISRTEF